MRETIAILAASLNSGELLSTQVLDRCIDNIEDPNGQGSKVFIRKFYDQARQAALASNSVRKAQKDVPILSGIPFAVKDLFDLAGSITSAGSLVLKKNPAALKDAPVIDRLRKAGAVIIGTTNMTEFAMGGLGINPHYGTPLNPYDRNTGRIPGGSSAGAAVAITDKMAFGSIGSDTAGSIQMPASLCGITGFKPTARRVPLDGSVPLAPSLDSIGPLANSVSCCILIDSVISGQKYIPLMGLPAKKIRLAIPQDYVLNDLDLDVSNAFSSALTRLSKAGIELKEVAFPEFDEIKNLPVNGSFSTIEGYAWHRKLLNENQGLYDPIVANRFMNGASVLAADYIDLINARSNLINRCNSRTKDFDAFIMPTLPLTAPPISSFENNSSIWLETNKRLIRNPGIANLLDRCAISIPCAEPGNAPVGISLVGECMGDQHLFSIALEIEKILKFN